MANTTFALRIADLIGDYAAKLNDNHEIDLLNAAIAEVADACGAELLLKYAVDPVVLNNSTPTWTSVEGKKVLLASRADAGGVHRACELIGIPAFDQAQDSDSIFAATSHSPVACITTDGGTTSLSVKPTPTASETVNVYYFGYPTTTQLSATNLNSIGIPTQLLHAIALRASIMMLQAYISDSVQDEEDTEILSMLTAQIGTLTEQYRGEMGRFVEGFTQGESN